MNLSTLEQETIINYNNAEKEATIFTYDKALKRKLDELCSTHKEISLLREENGAREYKLPKKWLKVRAPAILSDVERQKRAEAARARFSKGVK